MFSSKKKHSWFWFALWPLLLAIVIFFVARYFLHVVDKEARIKRKKQQNFKNAEAEGLFV